MDEDQQQDDDNHQEFHDGDDLGNVKVMWRFRPINNNEQERFGDDSICEFTENERSVTITSSRNVGTSLVSTNKFTFDHVFNMNVSQREVYEISAKPIIEGVLNGFNGTVFAYGQTGSGKTHTMQGPNIEDLEMQGIVPRMVRTVFNKIENMSENIEYTIKVSMLEIYMEHVKDLLDPTKVNLKIKENKQKGIYIQNLTERYIGSDVDVYKIMKIGNENRRTASTAMNDTSSRSHSIFIMNITQNNLDDFSSKSGTLYLVDLAGSEKVAKTNVSGQQLDEAKGINLSLSTLGKVIHALTDKKITHVPYRESKLTRILTESLGGNAKTCLIITCSPSPYNEQETVSTLRFGTAARNIKNTPKINKEYTIPELKKMVAKRDQLVSSLKKRIRILEEFIKENGLEPPSDEALERLAKKLKNDTRDPIGELNVDDKISDKDETDEDSSDSEEDKDDDSPSEYYDFIDQSSDQIAQRKDQKQQTQEIIKLVENMKTEDKASNKKIIKAYLELQEQLQIERESNKAQLDALSNLKEDYEVVESKLKKYQDEKDEFLLLKDKADQTIHTLKEQEQEFEHEKEITEARLLSIETELAEVKKCYLKAQNKIGKYEETGTDLLLKETQENKDFRHDVLEDNDEIKNEIKLLHDQLKEREEVIAQIQNMPDLESSIKSIIQESQKNIEMQKSEGKLKANSSLVKKMLFGDGDEQLIDSEDSCYLTPKEVVDLIKKQKSLKDANHKNKTQNKKLKIELENLKDQLKELASADNPDLQAIVETLVKEQVDENNEHHAIEIEKLMHDLADRVDKVCNLKIQLDSLQEINARLELLLNKGDYTSQNQINLLEKQLESLSLSYHELASEISVLKVDLQVSNKKNKSKDKKIEKLESSLMAAKDQNKSLEVIERKLRDAAENEQHSNRKTLDSNCFTGIASKGKVVKKIKANKLLDK